MSTNIVINQCLHGYDHGHRLLASSQKFPKQTQSLLLRMSDAASVGYTKANPSYLTGYPLSEIGSYALARTWAAHEMTRPGCVWTHTLIINFADLAKFQDLGVLEHIFCAVQDIKDFSFYGNCLNVNDSIHQAKSAFASSELIALVAQSLYLDDKSTVILPLYEDVDGTVLRVWSQQWPKLRRNFKFRTYSNKSSTIYDRFDLCFFDANLDKRTLTKSLDSSQKILIDTVTTNIQHLENDELRAFLWSYGADSDYLRECYIPLIKIWRYLLQSDGVSNIVLAWEEFTKFPRLSKRLEFVLLMASIKLSSGEYENHIVELLVNRLMSLKTTVIIDNIKLVASFVITLNDDYLNAFLIDNLAEDEIIMALIDVLPDSSLLMLIGRNQRLRELVLRLKSTLLCEEEVLVSFNNDVELLANYIGHNNALAEQIVVMSIRLELWGIVSLLIDEYGLKVATVIFDKIESMDKWGKRLVIIDILVARKSFIYDVFLSDIALSIDMLAALAQRLSIDDFADETTEPWLEALLKSDLQQLALYEDFTIFLFSRGYRNIGNKPQVFLALTFDILHSALAANRMSRSGWYSLEKCLLPAEFLSFDLWDKCKRLKKSVVDYYYRNNISIESCFYLTNNEYLFWGLFEGAEYKNRLLLRRLLDFIERNQVDVNTYFSTSRKAMIQRALRVQS